VGFYDVFSSSCWLQSRPWFLKASSFQLFAFAFAFAYTALYAVIVIKICEFCGKKNSQILKF
jgi:hypothetical protein